MDIPWRPITVLKGKPSFNQYVQTDSSIMGGENETSHEKKNLGPPASYEDIILDAETELLCVIKCGYATEPAQVFL